MYQPNFAPPGMQPAQNPPQRRTTWLRVLLIGIVLFIVTTIVMFWTNNSNLYPTVILIGNFLVPVTFVAFLYNHRHLSTLRLESVAICFVVGGILGVLGASILESLLLPHSANPNQGIPLGSGLLVGFIEEGCKIAALMILARRMRHTSEMDGLLLGGAVGMGFAALESTGYAFTVFLLSHGVVGASVVETVIRGLLAPFGHGVWTGVLGAVLFRESSKTNHYRITPLVIVTYIAVSLLHGFWDGLPQTIFFVIPPGIPISVTIIVLSIIGISLLVFVFKRAEARQLQEIRATTP
ncbi:MAG TPA: PrsW family intramembrane metalloprotease [Ktedonobacteraceae bacterium]|nr:PrsW family intramembrane metalloprotease [Ktedonobacteraceae bacterium]